MEKIIDINFIPDVVRDNMQLVSKISSLNGTPVFKVEVKDAWFGADEASKSFEEEKRKYETGELKGFIPNRTPRGLCMKTILIGGVIIAKDPITDEYNLVINPGTENAWPLPITPDTLKVMDKTTAEAVAEVIRGEKDSFFIDGKNLSAILNAVMDRDIKYLDELIEKANKAKVRLKGYIAENTRKANAVADAWVKSALPENVDVPGTVGSSKVHIAVTEN
jgi:hypothetical protein